MCGVSIVCFPIVTYVAGFSSQGDFFESKLLFGSENIEHRLIQNCVLIVPDWFAMIMLNHRVIETDTNKSR